MTQAVRCNLRLLIIILAALFVALLASTPSYGQFSSGIEGTVTDNSGAIIPGAKVVLTNENTGVATTAEANSAGEFHFQALGAGSYKVTASMPGFGTVVLAHIDLNASSIRDASVKLQPSTVNTEVTVDAAPTAVETDEAKISAVTTA